MNANDLASALSFIAGHADTPETAIHMVATMIDGVAGWTDLTPLNIETPEGDSLTQVNGSTVHIHTLLT